MFERCFSVHNYFYNKAVECIRNLDEERRRDKEKSVENKSESESKDEVEDENKSEEESDLKSNKKTIKKNLKSIFREKFIFRNKEIIAQGEDSVNKWMMEIPLDTREAAAMKAEAAWKTGMTQVAKKLIKSFKLQFRSKKKSTPVFYVSKAALRNGALFSRMLGKDKYLVSKRDQTVFQQSDGIFPITKQNGRYYACIIVENKQKILEPKNNICALDPGCRTFQTMYSPDCTKKFGEEYDTKLKKLYLREDRIKSILATKTLKSRLRYKLKKLCAKLRTKAKHIISDLHWKTAHYLTKNFQVILLPKFATKEMMIKRKRKIGSTVVRTMQGLSHYTFQQRLLYKAAVRGRDVIICNEHYTTRTCGQCGTINPNMGGKKIFTCIDPNCNVVVDRDIHAARNILIRGLSIYEQNM
jgi:putative transposase